MNSLLIVWLVIIVILLYLGIFLIRFSISLSKEKRIERYAIDSIYNQGESVIDVLSNRFFRFVNRVSKRISKYSFIRNISKRYEKYILIGDDVCVVDFIVYKLIIGVLFVLFYIFISALQLKSISLFISILLFLVGYYLYDIYLIYRKNVRIKKIQGDMLRAVSIMNNAFKSGKSTMQAVYIASEELPNPISYEFKKIYQDLKYGLSVDVVFDRFAKRVNIEEASYLASSLTILNKTGGNIVSVFDAIEKNLFDKKKLQEELKNLTGASNLVVKILLFVPFIFAFIIYIMDDTYFDPLFSSTLGYLMLFVIILMVVVYIFILQKIMKVRF